MIYGNGDFFCEQYYGRLPTIPAIKKLDVARRGPVGFATWIACNQWHSKGWVFVANHEVLMQEPWRGAHFLLCFSIGVFSYDAFDLLLSSIYIHCPLTLLHHAILVIGFSTALLINHGFNYLVLSLICELHSIFAHLRRLLRMLDLHQDGSLLVKGEWSLHWLAYFTTRLLLHLLLSIKLFLNWSKFTFAVERPMLLASIVGINTLNVALGFDLYKAFLNEAIVKGKSL
ncbi:hypothetical protein L7F22_033375 [Adiantum nelumboides]|nr:hypothetical protein [Adiantum nelumboides]